MAVASLHFAACASAWLLQLCWLARMTLSDRLKALSPTKTPKLGRPQELTPKTEEAVVRCLEMCAEFNYPMKKRNLQA